MWIRAGESVESSNHFKICPGEIETLSSTAMVSVTAPSACFRNVRRFIHAASLSAGDLQLDPFRGLEWKSTRVFKGQKTKSVVELGTERVVNAEQMCRALYYYIP